MNPALLDLILGQAAAAPPPFSPSDLSGLALWYDAADASTITLDGSNNVETWNNKGSLTYSVGQTDSTRRPTRGVSTQNGLPLLGFDGTDDWLGGAANRTAENLFGPNRDTVTWFFAARHTSGRRFGFSFWASAANQVFHDVSVGPFLAFFHNSTNSSISGSFASANFAIYGCRADIPGNSIVIRRDGAQVASSPPGSSDPFGTAANYRVQVPYQSSMCAYTLGECLLYNRALSDAEILQVEAYLGSKWGTI